MALVYRKNSDGTFTQVLERGNPIEKSVLEKMAAEVNEGLLAVQTVRSLTPAQLLLAHKIMGKYGEPIQKGLMTVSQAVDNATMGIQEEKKAIEDALAIKEM